MEVNVYRLPGPYTDFIKKVDFLLEIVNTVDRTLIRGDFNIHKEDEKDSSR